jgi:hypothetical protein
MSYNNGGSKKQSRPQDKPAMNTSLYFCIFCGFHALDYPGLQFHLWGSQICYEAITGKKQCTAHPVLSPCSLNQLSTSSKSNHCLSATSDVVVPPNELFEYNPVNDIDDDGSIFQSTNSDEDMEDQNQEEALVDKHDIDAKHLSEKNVLDMAKSLHFCPRDVDTIQTAKNNDIGGLKLFIWDMSQDMPLIGSNMPSYPWVFSPN